MTSTGAATASAPILKDQVTFSQNLDLLTVLLIMPALAEVPKPLVVMHTCILKLYAERHWRDLHGNHFMQEEDSSISRCQHSLWFVGHCRVMT